MITKTTYLHQPARQRFRCHRDYTRDFARWLGRSLSRAEKIIITPLEKDRLRKWIPRLLVIDPPGVNSKPLLLSYLKWIAEVVHHDALPTLICSPTKRTSTEYAASVGMRPVPELGNPLPGRSTYMLGARRPTAARGMNFRFALILDIDKYGKRSAPRPGTNEWKILNCPFNDIIRTVTGPTLVPGCSMLVYHASSPVYVAPAFRPPDPTIPIGIEELAPPGRRRTRILNAEGDDDEELMPIVIRLSETDGPNEILALIDAFLTPGARRT